MRIREEALPFAGPPALAAALLGALGHPLWAILPGALALAVCGFFRDPERTPPSDPDAIASPADGRIVKAEPSDGRLMISVFMSVFNVHVNRAPFDGTVEAAKYNPGKFMAAWSDKASLDNEQVRMTFVTPRGSMDVVMIAGLVARRIVCWATAGRAFVRGERIGLIRFGSRVDLYLPADRATSAVSVGDRVSAGKTVLARWKEQS